MTNMIRIARVMLASLMMVFAAGRAGAAAGDEAVVPVRTICSVESPRLPDTITIAKNLRPAVEAMLLGSSTFRQQCARLADRRLHVVMGVDVTIGFCTCRARSVIQHVEGGLILATVAIGPGGNPVQWIAHEFEHLLEQLEGLRLRDLADRATGVWRTTGDVFETERAIRAGLAVLEDMRPKPRRQDKFVE
jgi:hypothetical protein